MTPEPRPEYRWGTVQSVSPLTVMLDGDTQALVSPTTLESVVVNARVLVLVADRRATVLGSAK